MPAPEDNGKAVLEESGEEAEARKAANTGGQHRPGPVAVCPACKTLAEKKLTPYERSRHEESWAAWHRQSMLKFVPTEVLVQYWKDT